MPSRVVPSLSVFLPERPSTTHTKFGDPRSNGSVVRANRNTDLQVDGTDFIPSTADAGGKNAFRCLQLQIAWLWL